MTLREFIQTHDIHPRLSFKGQWSASLDDCEIKDGQILKSFSGYGETARAALLDMLQNMRGRRIVKDAMDKNRRREFVCPETTEIGDLK